jgi:UDP:flavonoid glycosyltransferase YjiC (YdhE family)
MSVSPMSPSMSRPVIIAYITGHGYGHFTRAAAVLERVAERAVVHLRTNGRALALSGRARWAASVTEVDVGPGVAQRGPLTVDLERTRVELEAHLAAWPRLVPAEAAALRAAGAHLVVADVPPIAFAAAAQAGVPALAISNFTWSWIYEGYVSHDPWFGQAAGELQRAEAQATACLALEMGGGLDVFGVQVPIPPVGRRPTRSRSVLRACLGLREEDERDSRPLVLVSFGGFGGELDIEEAAAKNRDLRLLVVSAPVERPRPELRSIEPDDEMPHQDLIAAADCVIGKLGYGTVVECLLSQTPLVHVPRGDFREEAELARAVARYLPQAVLSVEDFRAGRWSEAVARARAVRPPELPPAGDGIAAAVQAIFDRL